MKITRARALVAVSAAALMGLAACNNAEPAAEAPAAEEAAADAAATPAGDVVAVASGNADFSTLVTAVQAAGLVETLQGAGPFTVFAPTNAAFEKIPAADLQALLQPEQRTALTGVLTYHVVPGNVSAAALAEQITAGGGQATLTTVEGGTLTARANADGSITLTDEKGGSATVVQADVAASNGVIHAIDTVVMPN
ncbi:fasciclin domain-containing protein [Pseudanabaena biceps]|nr:fasciclin domain-containing protein [Pseudanabaena biceps]